jgi:16S rRNA pseudouridine516 synthase
MRQDRNLAEAGVGIEKKVYYMFHKPQGCITATTDKEHRTVLDYFEPERRAGIFPVGRLDKDTEGLLLVTNDGVFSHSLMYPDKQVEKTYYFWAYGKLDQEAREHLLSGVRIGTDEPVAKATRIEIDEEGLYRTLEDRMADLKCKEISFDPTRQCVISGYITITEGRKHQVKRMLKGVGCYVAYLKRVSIGNLVLDEALQKGQYRALTEEELESLSKKPKEWETTA